MSWARQYLGLWIGISVFVLCMLFFIIMLAAGWPGGADDCLVVKNGVPTDNCYCEKLRSGPVKQPANTWSDLAFVIVGLALLVVVARDKKQGEVSNAMLGGGWIPILYGCVVIFMGPGSMYFHASMVDWAGFMDSTSMFLLLTFIIGYDLYQFTRTDLFKWLSWLIAVAIMVFALILVILLSEYAVFVFIAFAVLTGLFDLILHIASDLKRSWAWYAAFVIVFLLMAVPIWILSGTDKPWCVPDQVVFQGHAWWHILSAVAMICLFYYFRSEKKGRRYIIN